jgi:hypothetical protein
MGERGLEVAIEEGATMVRWAPPSGARPVRPAPGV